MVQDVVLKTVDSRSLNNEENRLKYLAEFSKADRPGKTKAKQVITSKDFKEVSPTFSKKRTALAPKDMVFALKSRGVERMLGELQTIDYHRFPNAAHDLLRSFLECALKAYFEDIGKPLRNTGKNHVFLSGALDVFKKEMDLLNNCLLYTSPSPRD